MPHGVSGTTLATQASVPYFEVDIHAVSCSRYFTQFKYSPIQVKGHLFQLRDVQKVSNGSRAGK